VAARGARAARRSGMTKHENIAKALKARLSDLTTRVGEIDGELRKPLSADLEEQATDLVKPPITLYSMYKVTNISQLPRSNLYP
jgi:hypothetical protein